MVIVESKHVITEDKLSQKMKQMVDIKNFIGHAKMLAKDPSNKTLPYTSRFKNMMRMYKFDEFEDQPMLYIGGGLWKEDAKTYLQELLRENPSMQNHIGIIKESGKRFQVADASTAFRTFVPVSLEMSQRGGANRQKKRKER